MRAISQTSHGFSLHINVYVHRAMKIRDKCRENKSKSRIKTFPTIAKSKQASFRGFAYAVSSREYFN